MGDPVFRALLIGCSTYPEDPHNLPALKGPRHDLRLLEDALTHPQVGLHDRAGVQSLLDCTRGEILEKIEGFFADADRDSQLLFYYSGHGRQDGRGNLYLCARDTRSDRLVSTSISDEMINAMIGNSAAGRVVLVLDCCHSGSFKGLDLPDTLKGTGRFLLTSCRSRELSVDAGETDGPSAFTRHLVGALLSGEVDTNRDGFVSLNEVYDYVLPRLKADAKQIPQRHFDRTVAEVALGRTVPREPAAAATGAAPAARDPDGGPRPVLNVSETSIDIAGVKPGEELPPEIVDVFNEGGGTLDWTVQCDDDWIEVEKEKGFVKVTLRPRPGVNRGRIYVRDRGRGGSRTIRVNVEMAEEMRKPKLEVSETHIDFGTVARGGKAATRTFRLDNAGGGELRAVASAGAPWIDVRQYGEMVDVVPRTSEEGTFAGEVIVKSDGGEARIPVTAVIEQGPILDVDRHVSFGLGTVRRTLLVGNAGRGKLVWSFTTDGDFFVAERSGDRKSGKLDALVVRVTAQSGRHRGTIRITSNGGDATVDVSAEIEADPNEISHDLDEFARGSPDHPRGGPPPLPIDLRGRWNTGAGVLEIGGTPPQYQFVEQNLFGIVVGQGTAFQQGAFVQFQGFNLLAGPFSAQMQVMGNQMSGSVTAAGNVMPLTLVRM